MERIILAAAIALLAAGCDARTPPAPEGQPSQAPAPVAQPHPQPTPQPLAQLPAGRTEKVTNDLYEFEYAYPPKAAAIPGLKTLLDKRLATSRAELEKSSKSDQVEANKNGYPYRAHSSGAKWAIVADLPRWLSLSAEMYEYSGGAHGMTFFDALLWDREQNLARTAGDLFISKAALSAAIREPFCAALDKERVKRRGEPVNRQSGDEFDACIDPAEHAVILGSSNGKTFDRIGILVEPYAAGAYAEGTFDITLPVTERIIGSVKPAYKDEFSVR
ncbi:DUF4163 domain-containing protein [Novosphingobium sp. 9U]|uniref:DUF4163 domain-containing protein n=1 Tax=Novosphingobium sp. 9U TaxID=2653158 RepID=UPI0012F38B56|nr:DUF4163 domain-containing protein [Novosphingobium sp. 9U]VWX52821.1 conserved hypothetical protein [Novosphingobium sp. 9U]